MADAVVPAAPAPAVAVAPAAPAVTPADNVANIENEEVPLAVNENTDETTDIQDEETPLAANGKAADGLKTWWWWIAAAVAAVTGKGIFDRQRRKPVKNEESDDSKDQK